MPKEITEDYIKEKINSWFLEEDNKHSIATFLKSLILQKINEEDMQINLQLMKKVCDHIDVSISLLISDFFLQNYFHYSLSVFSSEIFSTSLKDYVCDYFNKISHGWDPRKLPTLDYTTVYKILLSLDINPKEPLGADIISRYYLLCEGSLLKIIISIIKNAHEIQVPQIIYPAPSCENKCVGTDDSFYSYYEIVNYFDKKESDLESKIYFQQQEFAHTRKLLSSCHETLKTKLKEAQILIRLLKDEKNELSKLFELVKNQGQLIIDLSEQLSTLSLKLQKIEDLTYDHNTSSSPLNEIEKCQKTSKDQSSQTDYNSKSISCQFNVSVKDVRTDTNGLRQTKANAVTQTSHMKTNAVTQTESLVNVKILEKLEEEKMEFITFIEQLQNRIKTLTEKAITLNKIIAERKSSCCNNAEVQTAPLNYEIPNTKCDLHKKRLFKCCETFQNLDKIVECHSVCIDTLKNKLKFLKEHSLEADAKCNSFIEKQVHL